MATSAADRPLLYDHSLCHDCQIVRLCLAEKGVTAARRSLDVSRGLEQYDPWFVALNPQMSVPVLRHGERVVAGAEAICRYVDGAFPGPLLDHRNEAQSWIDLERGLATELLELAGRGRAGRRALRRRFRRLEARAAANPALAEAFAREAARIDRLARDLESRPAIAAVERQVEVTLDRADAALAHRDFLTGESFTLADVFWAALMARLEALGYARLWQGDARPALAAYWQRLQARPSLRAAGVHSRIGLGERLGAWLQSGWVVLLRLLLALALAGGAWWIWLRVVQSSL